MANGYGGSSSSSGSSGSPNTAKLAPVGFHYMDNGELMSDIEHFRKFGGVLKKLRTIEMDFNNISQKGALRNFIIKGSKGSVFSLEIKNNSGLYYNFSSRVFQAAETKLDKIKMNKDYYENSILFPAVTVAAQYDIYLIADYSSATIHAAPIEVRLEDGALNVNASIGSHSLMLRKVLFQTLDVVLTINPFAVNAPSSFGSMSVVNSTVTAPIGVNVGKVPFKISFTSANGKAFAINQQPSSGMFAAFAIRTIGSAGITIPGEDKYGGAARSSDKVVNGAVTSGSNVTMDDDVGTLWAVGDRITGNDALDVRTRDNAVTITAVSVGGNDKIFTMSEAIAIADDETLTFTSPYYYKWPVDDSEGLVPGISIVPGAGNITGSPIITTEADLNIDPDVNVSRYKRKVEKTEKPVFSRDATTKLITKTQGGNIVFSEQQLDVLKDDSLKFFGYGSGNIKSLLGWDVEISNLKATLTVPTTNTAAAVSDSVTVTVDSGHGIMDDVTSISSINIDSSAADPIVTTIASYNVSSAATATLTLSAAQTLEDNELLTLNGAGQTITVTGDIVVKNASASATLRLDVTKFITATTETA